MRALKLEELNRISRHYLYYQLHMCFSYYNSFFMVLLLLPVLLLVMLSCDLST